MGSRMPSPVVPVEVCLEMRRSCLSLNLRQAARRVTAYYDAALARTGLTAVQLPVLAAIAGGADGSSRELAGTLDLEPSTLSRNLAVLERAGLLRKRRRPGKRGLRLELTGEGEARLEQASNAWRAAHDELRERLGDELEALLGLSRSARRAVGG